MEAEISLTSDILASIERAIAEDIGAGDITTDSIVGPEAVIQASVICRKRGVVAGISVARAVFQILDKQVVFRPSVSEGEQVRSGQTIAEINGLARAILTGERTALNFMGRMSGIATLTRQFVNAVSGTRAKILDTRKTAPNLRACDKMAVRLGGGHNHRFGLYDMVLIKDNHVDFAGSITAAVNAARRQSDGLRIEVEARTLAEVAESLDADVSCIMLDNMQPEEMKQAVELARGRAALEASGNVTVRNVRQIAETGVDYISVGALTHSAPALDLSLIITKRSF